MDANVENLPRITIVVPSYNAHATIARALESLIAQNYSGLEIICVDGSSNDGTQRIIEKYQSRIAISISEPDRCQSDALNKGFRISTGEVLGWLCADDELIPGTLRRVGEHFVNSPEADVVTGGCRRKFPEYVAETCPELDFYDLLYLKNTIEQPSTFWRRRVYEHVGELNVEMKYAFDWEYWCRMKRDGFRFSRINEVLSIYHFSESNLTSTGGRSIVDEMYRIVRKYGPYGGRIAWAYKYLYLVFDLHGSYDVENSRGRLWKSIFHLNLRLLYLIFDELSINAYNWNFASKQERGLGW